MRQPSVESLTELRWKRKGDCTIAVGLGMTRRGKNTARLTTAALSLRRERHPGSERGARESKFLKEENKTERQRMPQMLQVLVDRKSTNAVLRLRQFRLGEGKVDITWL